MSTLINELKKDHERIYTEISDAKKLGISTEAGKKLLLSIKTDLINHLKKEDELLYPKLKELAQSDEGIKKTLDTFAKDMEGITTSAMEFFDKYTHQSSDIEFFKDIGRFLAALTDRIRKEENTLYRIYDEATV
ncbi:MAG: hemerythrin domain-containing protein [Leptospirales bacterium]